MSSVLVVTRKIRRDQELFSRLSKSLFCADSLRPKGQLSKYRAESITKATKKMERASKPASASNAIIAVQMLPSDANPMGNVHGGTILKYVDMAAAAAALRHARKNVVTASIDRMDFIQPVYVGNLLTLKASVNYAGRTSMEVGVRVEAEDLRTGKIVHTNSSYVTYVALDDQGRPTEIPELIPQTAEEKRRWREARERRQARLRLLHRQETRQARNRSR